MLLIVESDRHKEGKDEIEEITMRETHYFRIARFNVIKTHKTTCFISAGPISFPRLWFCIKQGSSLEEPWNRVLRHNVHVAVQWRDLGLC